MLRFIRESWGEEISTGCSAIRAGLASAVAIVAIYTGINYALTGKPFLSPLPDMWIEGRKYEGLMYRPNERRKSEDNRQEEPSTLEVLGENI